MNKKYAGKFLKKVSGGTPATAGGTPALSRIE
jgi:hypothetical protein